MKEQAIVVPACRVLRHLDLGENSIHWFEMDHQGESPRTLMSIIDLYLNHYRWDRFIREGSTVIDIGAHSGDTAIPMQYLARGTVLAIEPNPSIAAYLELNCAINSHLGRFVTSNHAVTTQDHCQVDILDHCNSMCNGGLIDPNWSPELKSKMLGMNQNQVTVPGSRLATIVNDTLTQQEIQNISMIKLDTEGHDYSIINDSKELITEIKPVIFAEWFFAYTNREIQSMFDVISSIGYRAWNPTTWAPMTMESPRSEDLLLLPVGQQPGDHYDH